MADISVTVAAVNIDVSVDALNINIYLTGGLIGLQIAPDAYLDDDEAIGAGLISGSLYALAENNNYTLPPGLIKQIP